MIEVKILSSPSEIHSAKHLLYQDYYYYRDITARWIPEEGNPSGLHIDHSQEIYSDNYDEVATWFGVYISGEIIGCCRLCTRLEGMFEIEHYLKKQKRSLPKDIKQEKLANELNRCATHEKFRRDIMIFAKLTGFVIEYSLNSNIHVFSTTGYNDIDRHKQIGYKQCKFAPFRYSESDPNFVDLVYTTDKAERKKRIIKLCATIAKSYQQKAP
jgi:hypothetical protein